MAKFRVFRAKGVRYSLVEEPEARKRDIKTWAITLDDLDGNTRNTFYQDRDIKRKVRTLPLSVRIYNTPREILESMLRAAVSDEMIETTFEIAPSALRRRSLRTETRTLKAIATEAALSSAASREAFRAKIEDGILLLKVLTREFKSREAEEYNAIVFDKLDNLFDAIVVDLKEVAYMNSSGISVLARTAGALPLRIVSVSDNIRTVMDLMGLLPLLAIESDQETAVASLKSRRSGGAS